MPGRSLRFIPAIALSLTCAGATAGQSIEQPPQLIAVFTASGDRQFPILVNGVAGTVVIDPGAFDPVQCSADFAARAKIVADHDGTIGRVGPIKAKGSSAKVLFRIETKYPSYVSLDTAWSPGGHSYPEADCAFGPEALDAPIVRFELHAPQPGETTVTLPILKQGTARLGGGLSDRDGAINARVEIGGKTIGVRFDLNRRLTVATSGAAQSLARVNGGWLDGPVESSEIQFGIARPVRRLRLTNKLVIGPLSLDSVFARIDDYGDASRIRTTPPRPSDVSPDDIIVNGDRRKRYERIRIGADDMTRCSSIVFDKRAGTITLSCR